MLNLYDNYKYLNLLLGLTFPHSWQNLIMDSTIKPVVYPMELESSTFSSLKCLIIKLGTKVIKSIDENCKFMINLG